MPPKAKYTKEQIVAAALNIVSQKGVEALTAKKLSSALGTSTSPIFTVFRSMQELQEEVRTVAMQRFEQFTKPSGSHMPIFKQVGMKMVSFAVHEPKLYQFLFMGENSRTATFEDVFGELGATAALCMESIEAEHGLNPEQAKLVFENVWIYTYGIGALCATRVCSFTEAELGRMLSTQFLAMMLLIVNGTEDTSVLSRRIDQSQEESI